MPDVYHYRPLGGAAIVAAALLGAAVAPVKAEGQRRVPGPACARCYTLEIPLERLENLPPDPPDWLSSELLIHVPTAGLLAAAADAAERLRSQGIPTGIVLNETWLGEAAVSAVAGRVGRLLVRLDGGRSDQPPESRLFALRQGITRLRVAAPEAVLGLDPLPDSGWRRLFDGVRGYVDFVVLAQEDASPDTGPALLVWRKVSWEDGGMTGLSQASALGAHEHLLMSWPGALKEQAVLEVFAEDSDGGELNVLTG